MTSNHCEETAENLLLTVVEASRVNFQLLKSTKSLPPAGSIRNESDVVTGSGPGFTTVALRARARPWATDVGPTAVSVTWRPSAPMPPAASATGAANQIATLTTSVRHRACLPRMEEIGTGESLSP